MNEEALKGFLSEMGLWPLKRSGLNHFKIDCFYQESRHEGGYDRHPSATISFDQGVSWFTCFTCETRQPFWKTVERASTGIGYGRNWTSLARRMSAREEFEKDRDPAPRPGGPRHAAKMIDCSGGLERIIRHGGLNYPSEVVELLESKGVSPKTARKFLVAFVRKGHVDEFLQKDENDEPIPLAADCLFIPTLRLTRGGKLKCYGGQGRPLEQIGKKYFTMYPYPSRGFVYGEHLFPEMAGRPIFVVEGQFDVMHIHQEDHCAGGLFGLHANPPRVIMIANARPSEAIVFTDPDPAGERVRMRIVREFQMRGVAARSVTSETDPKHCLSAELTTFAKGG